MADFKLFEPILLRKEGDWTVDDGGETWKGISRNSNPKWLGWAFIDRLKPAGGFNSADQADILLGPNKTLQALVDNFYKCEEWDLMRGDQINNQSIANFLVDWGVNAGVSVPIKHAQIILKIPTTGMGPQTISCINSNSNQNFFNQLQEARQDFYLDLANENANDKQYLKGWLMRNQSFKFSS